MVTASLSKIKLNYRINFISPNGIEWNRMECYILFLFFSFIRCYLSLVGAATAVAAAASFVDL